MSTTTAPSAAESATFDQWLAYYTERFTRLPDDALKGYWWLYGRDSETLGTPRDEAAWAAVNAAMQERDL